MITMMIIMMMVRSHNFTPEVITKKKILFSSMYSQRCTKNVKKIQLFLAPKMHLKEYIRCTEKGMYSTAKHLGTY